MAEPELTLALLSLLHRMMDLGASDLHLKVGSYPGMRVDGRVKPQTDMPRLTSELTESLVHEILSPEQLEVFEADGDLDTSYSVAGLARFRVNVLWQRRTVAMVLRVIPNQLPSMEELGLPPACTELAMRPRGLVLVTGPTGSGKSTTLAAMVNHVNEHREGHILTMEDPLEFVHEDKLCYVTQREIGTDCKSFRQALRRGLRQDPDVILIGELRDHETIEMALTAAETGHLVMATLHTTNSISSVDRIIDVFPSDAQEQVRVQLSNSLQGVVSQTLLNRIGGGQVAATEVLICTDGVRSLIREGKTSQMLNFLQTGSKYGMNTLEQALVDLVNGGLIEPVDAVNAANRPQDVRRAVRMPSQAGGIGDALASAPSKVAPDAPPRAPRPAPGLAGPGAPTPQSPPAASPLRRSKRKGGLFDRS